MRVNADFDERVLVHAARLEWTASPMPGVERRMLDRIGGEVARATSIVRYAPDSAFSPHTHDGGEEFLVLDGVFQDEHGDFPTGSYVRNPPTSRHTPRSEPGCVIFVKLHQFASSDRTHVCIASDAIEPVVAAGREGAHLMPLFRDEREEVRLEQWDPHVAVDLEAPGGLELLVLAGAAEERGDTLLAHSWLRLPVGDSLHAVAGPDGARVWMKTGHLRHVNAPPGTRS